MLGFQPHHITAEDINQWKQLAELDENSNDDNDYTSPTVDSSESKMVLSPSLPSLPSLEPFDLTNEDEEPPLRAPLPAPPVIPFRAADTRNPIGLVARILQECAMDATKPSNPMVPTIATNPTNPMNATNPMMPTNATNATNAMNAMNPMMPTNPMNPMMPTSATNAPNAMNPLPPQPKRPMIEWEDSKGGLANPTMYEDEESEQDDDDGGRSPYWESQEEPDRPRGFDSMLRAFGAELSSAERTNLEKSFKEVKKERSKEN